MPFTKAFDLVAPIFHLYLLIKLPFAKGAKMKLAFEVTPSFICSIIRKSSSLKSDSDVISAFEKLSLLQGDVLNEEHAEIIDDKETERRLLFDNIDPKLLPLAHDLYGLTEVEESDTEEE